MVLCVCTYSTSGELDVCWWLSLREISSSPNIKKTKKKKRTVHRQRRDFVWKLKVSSLRHTHWLLIQEQKYAACPVLYSPSPLLLRFTWIQQGDLSSVARLPPSAPRRRGGGQQQPHLRNFISISLDRCLLLVF